MKFHLVHPSKLPPADVLIVGCFDEKKSDAWLPKNLREIAAAARTLDPEFGKRFIFQLLPGPKGLGKAVLVIGLGKKNEWKAGVIRQAATASVRAVSSLKPKHVAIVFPVADAPSVNDVVDGVIGGTYDHSYKTKEKKRFTIEAVSIALEKDTSTQHGEVVGEAVNFVRRLVDEPANKMTPTRLAKEAMTLHRQSGVSVNIIGEDEARNMGMGAFAAVSQGSEEEGKVIVLTYKGGKKDGLTVGLVGKGITFDSGGLSLKPDKAMENMKLDMAGGATVLGIIQAAALLKLPINLLGIVMAAENSPSGKAIRPGDVVTAMSGKTIEIVNTDAEGRLVIADGLIYAEKLGATHLVDLGTVTGACMVALGPDIVGLMGNNRSLIEKIQTSAQTTGERMWPLPLNEDFSEYVKSDIADVKNTGGPYGGAITCAKFIELVIETKKPWAHLDIAGPAYEEKGKPFQPKGGTGVMLRTLLHFLEDKAKGTS